jgi:hypothetical protein
MYATPINKDCHDQSTTQRRLYVRVTDVIHNSTHDHDLIAPIIKIARQSYVSARARDRHYTLGQPVYVLKMPPCSRSYN